MRLPGGSQPSAGWVADGHPNKHGPEAQTEFRRASPSNDPLLLRVVDHADGGYYYAKQAFLIDSRNGVRARPAKEEEWTHAQVVTLIDPAERYARLAGKIASEGADIVFEGRRYRPKGKYSPDLFLSPSGIRVAVLSFTSPGGSFDVPRYTYYVDVYETSSGKLLASAEGDAHGYNSGPGVLQNSFEWVTDRYLYLPLGAEHDHVLWFHFDAEDQ